MSFYIYERALLTTRGKLIDDFVLHVMYICIGLDGHHDCDDPPRY